MTVIHKYAYKAVWDASELSKGLMNTRALFQAQKKIVEDSRSPFDRLAIGQENLNKLVEKYPDLASRKLHLEKQLEKQYLLEESAVRKLDAAERQRLNTLLTTAEKQERAAARMEKARARVEKRYRTFDESSASERMSSGPNWAAKDAGDVSVGGAGLAVLGKAGAAAVAAVAVYKLKTSLSDLVSQGIEANRAMERAEITFEHFGGSAEVSARMVARLKEMSSDLGVSFRSLSGGSAQLMMKGFSGDETLKRMSQLAQVSGGDAEKMDRLALAMAQVRDKGRFYAEELQQLQEAGFSPTIELAQVLGVQIADIRKEMEKGNVTWVELAKAMDLATEKGGRYNGFLERFRETSTGAANASSAAWEDASARVGQALEPVTMAWSKFSTMIASNIADSADVFANPPEIAAGDPKGERMAGDPKGERMAKREKELADKLAANRKREQDALAAMNARNNEQSMLAVGGLKDLQFEQMKELIPDKELEKFQRVYSLLSDYNKEQAKLEAIENFQGGMGLGDFSHMLGEEAKQELKKTEQLEKQVALRQKQQEIIDKSKQIAEKFASEEQRQVDALAELEMARRFGGLSQADFDRESKKVVATENRGGSGLASSIRSGSSEAYQFMAGVQDRNQREKQIKDQESKQLQLRMIKAIEKVEAAVKDSELAAAG